MKNAFTVDLEDWFCSHNLKNAISFKDWDRMESRVVANSMLLIDLLSKHCVKATFFALGWVAERYPDLIKILNEEGHEIASHGYAHQQITCMGQQEFEQDLVRSKSILENITGKRIKGYRAPAFSITRSTAWALSIIRNQGFVYDSSIYPISVHPDYGDRNAPLQIHMRDTLIEVPLSCVCYGSFRIPCSGGAYIRFYPFKFFSHFAKKVSRQRPYIFYIHPWELDQNPPRVALGWTRSIRHYHNTKSTLNKVRRLLCEMEFTSIENIIEHESKAVSFAGSVG